MKRISEKLRIGVVPLILIIALILTGILSVRSINNLEGNARVINYTGIIRGATQRLIKKELAHAQDDKLIAQLDGILTGLSNGSTELNLIKLQSEEYQSLLAEMKKDWSDIKSEIMIYRDGGSGDKLFNMSEDYFDLANQVVMAAEVYTDKIVQDARNLLFYINIVFILMAGMCTIFAFCQDKRRRGLIEVENENRLKREQLSKRFQELLVPINEITELMYVSDLDTYELLFVNEAGKKTFNINDEENLKCYKVLQGFDSPCSFCPNSILTKDENYTWEYTNPLTKRHYLLKDRLMEWEGRTARMEIAFDITEATNEKIELKNGLKREHILVECIRELYRNHEMIDAANYVLEQVGKLFLAERSYIFLFHGDNVSNIAEWCKEGITPQIDNLQDLPQSDFAIWLNMFQKQENVIIHDLEDLKMTMELEYEFLAQQGIKRMIMVPLKRNGKLDGCMGLDNLSLNLIENAVTFIETLSYFIMIAMSRNENEEVLYRMSYLDTLTSFYNRNRYIHDIDKLVGKTNSVGVVYLDVNGLKEINDNFGHDSGDELLKRCAKIIQNSFETGSCYRIGGDEFVIICTDITEKEFNEKVQKLKNNFMNDECKAAIGSKWEVNCKNIQSTIKNADELMYADKKEFYHNHQPTGRYRHYTEVLEGSER
ncbi:sensor domain-containing diguanylate cyclase [Clostridioides sp. ZZV15-6598]|uniref:sensor domain-containing diguanylate cyclase n=1 Tax=Clostridioides sp. ZZV15-6598 TaxID=2811501 RepID=UPI001D12C1B6|nr:diguanylate cyclase [Clostridioides sp. ZZV15-6598]